MSGAERYRTWGSQLVVLCSLLFLARHAYAQNKIMGEVEFVGATQVEKHSGLWVDGQYLGYLDELKGARKVLLLPGEHQIVVRESGYKDFTAKGSGEARTETSYSCGPGLGSNIVASCLQGMLPGLAGRSKLLLDVRSR
jgi:hypothetical protein